MTKEKLSSLVWRLFILQSIYIMLMYTTQMSSPISTMIFKFLTISLCFYQCASSLTYGNVPKTTISTIIVDQSGKGNFTKVQDAIDSIPENNSRWVRVRVRAGIYNEKVTIPHKKPFIVLEGDGRSTSVIQAAEGGSIFGSSTFTVKAANFMAQNIAFKNNHDKHRSRGHTWAPAAVIAGDKAAFYKCDFISVQDTLTDSEGRHYFESCYIQGVVDFIWGGGQSIYKGCTINVSYEFGTKDGRGYITAQARRNAHSPNGFVFKNCTITGTISAYLGRAYTPYSRVLFYQSHFERTVVPEGWYAWNCAGREKDIIFAEKDCEGPGAHTNHRVKWEKNLSSNEVKALVDVNTFINQDGWMYKLPRPQ